MTVNEKKKEKKNHIRMSNFEKQGSFQVHTFNYLFIYFFQLLTEVSSQSQNI